MANNFTVTKVMYATEEAAPPVHVPILVGNDVYMVTQQDVRRIEEVRHLTYNRILPTDHTASILHQVLAGARPVTYFSTLQSSLPPSSRQETQTFFHDVDMEKAPKSAIGLSYSVGTSTSGLGEKTMSATHRVRLVKKSDFGCQTCIVSSKACSTGSKMSIVRQTSNTNYRDFITTRASTSGSNKVKSKASVESMSSEPEISTSFTPNSPPLFYRPKSKVRSPRITVSNVHYGKMDTHRQRYKSDGVEK